MNYATVVRGTIFPDQQGVLVFKTSEGHSEVIMEVCNTEPDRQ